MSARDSEWSNGAQLSVPGPTVSDVSEDMSVGVVSERVLDELADVLTDRLDQLLDRLTDRALAAPTPGSAVWETEWSDRDTASGRARVRERLRVRAELVRRAGAGLVDCSTPPLPVAPKEASSLRPRRARAGRGRVDDGQLAFF